MTTLLPLLLALPLSAPLGSAPQDQTEKPAKPMADKAMSKEDPALAGVREFLAKTKIDKTQPSWKTKLPKPPQLQFDPASDYFWKIETNKGPIKVRFLPDVAPMHVSSTMYLTELGFYDGLSFHRVIPQFMAQGGCPLGTGTGNPGYAYAGEFDPKVKHDKPGKLSMANAGPGTDGSQFFLTFVPTPHLDGKHTIFGEVVEGMETVRELERFGTSPQGRPKEPLTMTKCTLEVAPKKAAEPEKQGQGS